MLDRLAQHLGNAVETTEVDLLTLQDRVTALWNEAQAQVRSLADRRKGLEAQQNRRKQLEQRLPQEQAQLTQVSQHKQTAEQALAGERVHAENLQAQLRQLEAQCSFPDQAAVTRQIRAMEAEAHQIESAVALAQAALDTAGKTLEGLRGQRIQLEALLAQTPQEDLDALAEQQRRLQAQKAALTQDSKTLAVRQSRNETVRQNVSAQSEALSQAEARFQWLWSLHETANGSLPGKAKIMLETYVQMAYFDRILHRANVRLMVMSGGQYELKRRSVAADVRSQSGLDLDVLDHYNGTERSADTLSGWASPPPPSPAERPFSPPSPWLWGCRTRCRPPPGASRWTHCLWTRASAPSANRPWSWPCKLWRGSRTGTGWWASSPTWQSSRSASTGRSWSARSAAEEALQQYGEKDDAVPAIARKL